MCWRDGHEKRAQAAGRIAYIRLPRCNSRFQDLISIPRGNRARFQRRDKELNRMSEQAIRPLDSRMKWPAHLANWPYKGLVHHLKPTPPRWLRGFGAGKARWLARAGYVQAGEGQCGSPMALAQAGFACRARHRLCPTPEPCSHNRLTPPCAEAFDRGRVWQACCGRPCRTLTRWCRKGPWRAARGGLSR